jgi:protein-tyrosine phosphatase
MKALQSKLSLTIKVPENTIQGDGYFLNGMSKAINNKSQCDHIVNDIYLSGYQVSLDYDFLRSNNFTHIINCAGSSKNFKNQFYDDFQYLVLNIKDEPGYDLLQESVTTVIEYIESLNHICPQRKILIHCFEGVSRAPTLLTSYIMWKFNMNKDDALKILKNKRPCVNINFGFLTQLEKFGEVISTTKFEFFTSRAF